MSEYYRRLHKTDPNYHRQVSRRGAERRWAIFRSQQLARNPELRSSLGRLTDFLQSLNRGNAAEITPRMRREAARMQRAEAARNGQTEEAYLHD